MDAPAAPKVHFVVFVHGVGQQTEGETLISFGNAVQRWLDRWHQERAPLPSATPCDLLGVAAAGPVVLAVGAAGTIVRSTDAGQTWQTGVTALVLAGEAGDQRSQPTATLHAVAFGSAQVAWAVGDGGTILRTDDAGLHWERQPSGTTADLRGIATVSAAHAWAVGSGGLVLRTSDGGASWVGSTVPGKPDLVGIAARSPTTLVAVGSQSLVSTADGGGSWSVHQLGHAYDLLAVAAAQESPAFWVVGRAGTAPDHAVVLKSVDDGRTWDQRPIALPPDFVPRTIVAHSAQRAWVIGSSGTILRTDDGGKTWRTDALASADSTWYGGVLRDTGGLLVVGSGGAIARSPGAGGDWVEVTVSGEPERVGRPSVDFARLDDRTPVGGSLQSYAKLDLPNGDVWYLTEAWWAKTNRFPGVFPLLRWLVWFWRVLLLPLNPAASWRALQLEDAREGLSLVDQLVERINIFANLCLQIAEFTVFIGSPVAILISQLLPWIFPSLRAAIGRLLTDLGELESYLTDPIQAAAMRQRIADAILSLGEISAAPNDDTIVIGHSLGSVIAHDLLVGASRFNHDVVTGNPSRGLGPVTKFISIGSPLTSLWKERSEKADQLVRLPLWKAIHWLNVFTWYDAAAQGHWLDPPRQKGGRLTIFAPDETVIAQQHLVPREDSTPGKPNRRPRDPIPPQRGENRLAYWPETWTVTNRASPLTDHTGYLANDEQVLTRLVAEIDQPYYEDSKYWRGRRLLAPGQGVTPELRRAFTHRYRRVLALGAVRAFTVFYALVGALRAARGPAYHAIAPLGSLGDVPRFLADFLWQPTARAALFVDWLNRSFVVPLASGLAPDGQPSTSPLLAGLLQVLAAIPFSLVAIVLALVFPFLFYFPFDAGWRSYDQWDRVRAIQAIANSGLPPAAPSKSRRTSKGFAFRSLSSWRASRRPWLK